MKNSEFGKRLKELRKIKGWSQDDLLSELDEDSTRDSKTTVSRWESGKTIPKYSIIENLEDVFQVPRGTLLVPAGYPFYGSSQTSDSTATQPTNKKGSIDDNEMLSLIAKAFDRPAFTTIFGTERSTPDFIKAISDTIQVLNTGIWKNRDGDIIDRIPSRHDLKDINRKNALAAVEKKLRDITLKYQQFIKTGQVKSIKWDEEFILVKATEDAAYWIDQMRYQIIMDFKKIYPVFDAYVTPPLGDIKED
jgi:hypothetical protein